MGRCARATRGHLASGCCAISKPLCFIPRRTLIETSPPQTWLRPPHVGVVLSLKPPSGTPSSPGTKTPPGRAQVALAGQHVDLCADALEPRDQAPAPLIGASSPWGAGAPFPKSPPSARHNVRALLATASIATNSHLLARHVGRPDFAVNSCRCRHSTPKHLLQNGTHATER